MNDQMTPRRVRQLLVDIRERFRAAIQQVDRTDWSAAERAMAKVRYLEEIKALDAAINAMHRCDHRALVLAWSSRERLQ